MRATAFVAEVIGIHGDFGTKNHDQPYESAKDRPSKAGLSNIPARVVVFCVTVKALAPAGTLSVTLMQCLSFC